MALKSKVIPVCPLCAGARRQHPAAGQPLQVGDSKRPQRVQALACTATHRRRRLLATCPNRHALPLPRGLRPRSEVELAQIAQELDAAEHALMASGGLESADFLQ